MKYQIQNQMNESSTEEKKDFSNEEQSYNRKQKSLGLLCSNFFNLYDDDDVEFLNLNDAANRLGVERRRMYDVVNVFEAIGVLVKKGKAQYYWKGLGGIANALKEMKEEALNDSLNISCDDGGTGTLVDQQTGSSSQENFNANSRVGALAAGSSLAKCSSSSSKNGGTRTGKSLRQLTEEFVKLLLCSDGKVVAFDQAARILLTDANNSSETRCNDSKVRRLYDIANVLSSVGLIEKTHYLNSGRPAFKWLGLQKEKLPVSKKRIFGTDLTNMSVKRNKTVSSMNLNSNSNNQEQDRYDLAHNPFGFDPTKLPKADASVKKTVTRSQAMLNLASTHIPPYRNQGLQGLFAHYTDAWGTWYEEIGKKPRPEMKSSEFISVPSVLRSS